MTDRVIVSFYRLSARPSRRLVCLPALVMPSTSRHFHPHYFNQSTRSYFFTSTMKKDANTRLSAVLYNVFSSIVYNIRFMDGFRISSSIKSRQIKVLDIKCVCVLIGRLDPMDVLCFLYLWIEFSHRIKHQSCTVGIYITSNVA